MSWLSWVTQFLARSFHLEDQVECGLVLEGSRCQLPTCVACPTTTYQETSAALINAPAT
jgi:hypothetical protein